MDSYHAPSLTDSLRKRSEYHAADLIEELGATIARLQAQLAEERERKWIPVTERLPDLHQPVVLLSVKRWENGAFDRNVQATGYLEDYGGARPFWSTYRSSETLGSYTHWKPLPEGPKT